MSSEEGPTWLQRLAWNTGWALRGALCGLLGHRLTVESTDVNGECRTLWCWCAGRYRYVGEEAG